MARFPFYRQVQLVGDLRTAQVCSFEVSRAESVRSLKIRPGASRAEPVAPGGLASSAAAGVGASCRARYDGGSTPMGSHFGVGEFTNHYKTYFSGDWDVHWGCGVLTHGHIP